MITITLSTAPVVIESDGYMRIVGPFHFEPFEAYTATLDGLCALGSIYVTTDETISRLTRLQVRRGDELMLEYMFDIARGLEWRGWYAYAVLSRTGFVVTVSEVGQ